MRFPESDGHEPNAMLRNAYILAKFRGINLFRS